MSRVSRSTSGFVRQFAMISLIATVAVAAAYLLAIFGVVLPSMWVMVPAFSVLALSAFVYIVRSWIEKEESVNLRWWMPVVWVALFINAGVVSHFADRTTRGGSVEYRERQAVLTVHGQVVRLLDAEGVRRVEIWDARELAAILLAFLSLVSLSLLAIDVRSRNRSGGEERG